ncbi:MAG: sulfotransferase domain-containing protein [Bacteroidetes bacterium]|nr:sulfotransferase domain-containing protein [Bacteroidota bacterium]
MAIATKVDLGFVCVGGNKCGTSWLYEMLCQHPELNVSINKEPHFFSENYEMGQDWYAGNWDKSSKVSGIKGELSTTYLYDEQAIGRLVNDYVDIKVLILLRNPRERALSHLRHVLRSGEINDPAEAVRQHPEIISNSLFGKWLSILARELPVERVKILFYDQISSDPRNLMSELFEFLSVDPEFTPDKLTSVVGKGFDPKSVWIEKLRRNTYYSLKKMRMYRMMRFIKGTRVTDLVRNLNDKNNDQRNITEVLDKYKKQLLDDLNELLTSPLISRDDLIKEWKKNLVVLEA